MDEACVAAYPDGMGAGGGPPAHPAATRITQPATAAVAVAQAGPYLPTTSS